MKYKGIVIAVDFDGTCVTHEFPNVGEDIGAQRVLKRLVAEGAKLILWTMRSGSYLQEAVDWFKLNSIPLYGIQHNPTQDEWTSSPKAYAQIYIDDAALGCPLIHPLSGGWPGSAGSERPYVDWPMVHAKLFKPEGS